MLSDILAILYIAMLYWLPVWWLLSPYLLGGKNGNIR